MDEEKVYVGNENGRFLAVDRNTGEVIWETAPGENIQSKALLAGDIVFIESANTFYALNRNTGAEVWKHTLTTPPEKFKYEGKEYLYKLDPYDDKRSSAAPNWIVFSHFSPCSFVRLNQHIS